MTDNIIVDDKNLEKTKRLTIAVSTIRRLRDSVSRMIEVWETFEREDIHLFEPRGWDALRPKWESLIIDMRGHISELRHYRTLLSQKLDHFNNLRNEVYRFGSHLL
jgi:hypothetical protein